MSGLLTTSQPAGLKQAFANCCGSAARVAADWLYLAATPTFAIMALLTALGGSEPDILCAAMQHASPLNGMIPMYLLMSVFHSAPWLKLFWGLAAGEVSVAHTTSRPQTVQGRGGGAGQQDGAHRLIRPRAEWCPARTGRSDCVAKTVRKYAFIDCSLQLSDHHL